MPVLDLGLTGISRHSDGRRVLTTGILACIAALVPTPSAAPAAPAPTATESTAPSLVLDDLGPAGTGCDGWPSSQLANLTSCAPVKTTVVAVSGEYATFTRAHANDGDVCTAWNSGGWPPQQVTLELAPNEAVSAIVFVTEMTPDGPARHAIEISDDGKTFRPAYLIAADLRSSRIYLARLHRPLTTRFLRVQTLAQQSWVAWREVLPVACVARSTAPASPQ